MRRKRAAVSVILLLAVLGLAGCGQDATQEPVAVQPAATQGEGLVVVATLFPQYDFAKQIVGEKGRAELLVSPGVEVHMYEPTAQDILKINQADVFVYTGPNMEAWAQKIINGLENPEVKVVDVSQGVPLGKIQDTDQHEEGYQHDYDPHIWTDPVNAQIMVDNILQAVCEQDPANADYYKQNAAAYQKELAGLDKAFQEVSANKVRPEIIFGGKFAFFYLTQRYDIVYQAAYDACTAEAEPSVKRMSQLIEEIKTKQLPVVYYEELSEPKVAKSIAAETGAKLLLLHSCHNVSKEDFANGVTYLDLMRQNVEALRQGLDE